MTATKKILIVDVDTDLQEMLTEQLELHGEFIADSTDLGRDAINKTLAQYYDIILMDVNLTDIDGREVCRIMRKNGIKSPIVMLSR